MNHDRASALALLKKHNKSESLIRHALAVEAVMRRFARHFGEDEERYGVLGLLHDLDYEKYPTRHCEMTGPMLREAGYGEEDIRAVLSHGYGLCTDIKPESNLEKTLFTIDELTGLVLASVYMRPTRSIMDFELKSLKKKWKDKAFAAGCDRALIQKGADMMGLDLDQVMTLTIEGMKEAAGPLGIDGPLPGR